MRSLPVTFPGTIGAGGGDGVLFDHFVSGLTTDPTFYCGHHDGRAEKEGKVVAILALDHGGVGVHLIEDRDKGFEETVRSKKRIGSMTRRTTEQETSPSFH
jgi:hypothetical protein